VEQKCKQQVADIESDMSELRTAFDNSCKDLEKANEFNNTLN